MIINTFAGGIQLPKLDNPGTAADLVEGKQLIGQSGEIITGTSGLSNVEYTLNISARKIGWDITYLSIENGYVVKKVISNASEIEKITVQRGTYIEITFRTYGSYVDFLFDGQNAIMMGTDGYAGVYDVFIYVLGAGSGTITAA